MSDLATGRVIIAQMREIDIDDLLGRSTVPADQVLMRSVIENHSILVTGGGGSIGSETMPFVRRMESARTHHSGTERIRALSD